jgi:hypothetical protein
MVSIVVIEVSIPPAIDRDAFLMHTHTSRECGKVGQNGDVLP